MLLGGTLTQLLASLGTPYAFDPPAGYVLFLEDVGERPYRLDRLLTQLRLSGLLGARRRASSSASCRGATSRAASRTARDVLARPARAISRARCCSGFPSGHTTGPTLTLPFGVRARVVADGRARARSSRRRRSSR